MKPIPSGQNRCEPTRDKIIAAAAREFSAHGLAGARTEAIARAAGVNKAMLYYYFKSKDDLYAAVLERVAKNAMEHNLVALRRKCTEGERLLRVVLNHFDRILTQREFQNLMQQEMIRLHKGEGSLAILVEHIFKPTMMELEKIVRAGMRKGELCRADWMQVVYAALGANVFYFLSAPLMCMVVSFDPYSTAALKSRRNAALEFLGSALFVDRNHGALLARRLLKEIPMPAPVKFPVRSTA